MEPTVISSIEIAAPATRVWELVSDLPGMGDFSPENDGGTWQSGATGPVVGAVFRGQNRRGLRRWSTRSTVTTCEPGRSFAFAVTSAGLRVARWGYELVETSDGCIVTESWWDERGPVVRRLGALMTGVGDRDAYTRTSIAQTLNRVKHRAEVS